MGSRLTLVPAFQKEVCRHNGVTCGGDEPQASWSSAPTTLAKHNA
jgi:hypothetical protein